MVQSIQPWHPPQKTARPVWIWTRRRKEGHRVHGQNEMFPRSGTSQPVFWISAPVLYSDMIRLVRPMSIYRARVTHGDATIAATDMLHASDDACPFVPSHSICPRSFCATATLCDLGQSESGTTTHRRASGKRGGFMPRHQVHTAWGKIKPRVTRVRFGLFGHAILRLKRITMTPKRRCSTYAPCSHTTKQKTQVFLLPKIPIPCSHPNLVTF